MKPLKHSIFTCVAISLTILYACNESDTPGPAVAGEFFPLTDGKEWQYNYAYFTTEKDSSEISSEIKTVTIDGDTTIENKNYKKFVDENGNLVKVVRREGTRFYGRKHELYGITHEYLFLDTSVPVGGTWSYLKDGDFSKTEYVVKAVHEILSIGNTTFRNVLEIEVNYYQKNDAGVMEFKFSAKHLYTDGMGETYAFYPEQANDIFADLNILLVGYLN